MHTLLSLALAVGALLAVALLGAVTAQVRTRRLGDHDACLDAFEELLTEVSWPK